MRPHAFTGGRNVRSCSVLALAIPAILAVTGSKAEQPLAPCHPNPNAMTDETTVRNRGDIVNLPKQLKDRLAQLANRPHTYLPIQAFAEAHNDDGTPKPSQLFQYYLLDTTGGFPPDVGFEANVFTTRIVGVNDHAQLTVTGAFFFLDTAAAVRLTLYLHDALPTDPANPRAFIDIFT